MRLCVKCGFQNREGYLFCEDCGFPLSFNGKDTYSVTQKLNDDDQKVLQDFYFAQVLHNKTTHRAYDFTSPLVDDTHKIKLTLDGQECLLDFSITPKIVLGRRDVSSPTTPDLDLSPFGAMSHGVSRIHATLERIETTITIMDMASSNGTYVNRKLLSNYQPHVLHDGDEIRLGKLTLNIHFMSV